MALLGDIRKRSWLLILGIGLPLLAFLIGDAFSQGSIFGNPNELGTVGGEAVNVQDYQMAYNRLSKNPQAQNMGETVLSEMAWNSVVTERLVTKQADELGIQMNEQAYFEAAGRFYRSVQPGLVDDKNNVNIAATKTFLAELENAAKSGNPQAANYYQQWLNANPRFSLVQQAYTDLVSAGALATNVDAAYQYNSNGTSADIDFVAVKYDDFATKNKVEVSDEQILAYAKEHPKTYKPEATVNLAYAYFPAKASEEDTSNILKELNSYLSKQIIKDEASGVTDTIPAFANAVNDSAYVSRFSDSNFDGSYYSRKQFEGVADATLKEALLKANKGDVIGPLKVGGLYELVKIADAKPVIDSAKTSHILIGYKGSQARGEGITRSIEDAKAMADSLLAVIKTEPAKFNELAATVSDDKVAAKDNGSIGWVGRFQQGFSASYRDWAVNNPKGSIDVVPSEFGFHIIRIDNNKTVMGYQIASIIKELKASEKTQEKMFDTANQLAIEAQGKAANDFINSARKAGAEVNNADGVKRFEATLTGLTSTKKEGDILRWAFNPDTAAGSVQTFETATGGQIVAYLSNKYDEDSYNVASLRKSIETKLRNQVIAKQIAEAENGTDLAAIAQKYGATVQSGNVSGGRPVIPGLGSEPAVGGAVLGLKQDVVSKAIKGNAAVFFVKIKSKEPATVKEDFSAEKNSIRSQEAQQIRSQLVNSLVEDADITDSRIEKLK